MVSTSFEKISVLPTLQPIAPAVQSPAPLPPASTEGTKQDREPSFQEHLRGTDKEEPASATGSEDNQSVVDETPVQKTADENQTQSEESTTSSESSQDESAGEEDSNASEKDVDPQNEAEREDANDAVDNPGVATDAAPLVEELLPQTVEEVLLAKVQSAEEASLQVADAGGSLAEEEQASQIAVVIDEEAEAPVLSELAEKELSVEDLLSRKQQGNQEKQTDQPAVVTVENSTSEEEVQTHSSEELLPSIEQSAQETEGATEVVIEDEHQLSTEEQAEGDDKKQGLKEGLQNVQETRSSSNEAEDLKRDIGVSGDSAEAQESNSRQSKDQSNSEGRHARSRNETSTTDKASIAGATEESILPAVEASIENLRSGTTSSRETGATVDNSASSPNPIVAGGESSSTARLPQHPLVRGTQGGEPTRQITDVEQTRFVHRITKALEVASNRDGNIRLRLSPPELGSLQLEVKVQGGALTAKIEAETAMARSLILENMPVLRERLAEQGIRVDQFDVDLSDRQQGGLPDDLAQENQRDKNSKGQTGTFQNEDAEADPSTSDGIGRPNDDDGTLNVVV